MGQFLALLAFKTLQLKASNALMYAYFQGVPQYSVNNRFA